MRTKEEKEKLNKKYGEESLRTSTSAIKITEKIRDIILNIIKTSRKEIMFIDTDCIGYK